MNNEFAYNFAVCVSWAVVFAAGEDIRRLPPPPHTRSQGASNKSIPQRVSVKGQRGSIRISQNNVYIRKADILHSAWAFKFGSPPSLHWVSNCLRIYVMWTSILCNGFYPIISCHLTYTHRSHTNFAPVLCTSIIGRLKLYFYATKF